MSDRFRPTPEGRHRAHHRNRGPVDDCWKCQRDRARCRDKLAFASVAEADEWVDELNASRGYAGRCVTRYPCAWCPAWHLKTARTPVEMRRIEKARRKAAIRRFAAASAKASAELEGRTVPAGYVRSAEVERFLTERRGS